MESDSLKKKTVAGLLWSVLDKGGQQLVVFASGIWLAKMLLPADYGLIGMLSIFTYLGNALQESGFTAAIIRKENLTKDDLNVAFFSNITIGVFIYALLFFTSPLIAGFFNEPQLEWLARVVFLMFLFNAFSVVQNALLIREMKFKRSTIINTVSLLLSYLVALIFAKNSAGAYAIAMQSATFAFSRMVMLWGYSTWRPTFTFKRESFNELFSFSSKLLLTNILNTCACRLFPSVIGKYYNTTDAGLYENGQRWGNMPQDFVSGTVANVTFPAISAVKRDDEVRMQRVCRKMVRVTAFLVFPLFIGIMVCCSPRAVAYIIKPEWEAVVPYILFICSAGIFNGLNTANYNVLKTKGLSSAILSFEVIRNILTITSILVCIPFGIFYMMTAMVVVSVINYAIFTLKVNRLLKIGFMQHIKDVLPYGVIMGGAALTAWWIGTSMSNINPIIVLSVQVAVMGVLYLGLGYIVGSSIISEVYNIIRGRGGKKL